MWYVRTERWTNELSHASKYKTTDKRRQWAIYYTSLKSFKITFSYSLT